MSFNIRYAWASVVLVALSGCGRSPVIPSGVPSPPQAVELHVLSGITRTAVPGARVTVGGREYVSDQAGVVSGLVTAATGADIDIQATGYLPRATRLVLQPTQQVTLWPIADDADADAVHRMVFGHSDVLYPFDASGRYFVTLLDQTSEESAQWEAVAAGFGGQFGISYSVGTAFLYEENEIAIVGVPRPGGWWCTPSSALGFCRVATGYRVFVISPERSTDPVTLRRVLASQFLDPNPLPGLLSPSAPTDTLSPLEAQAIRMILQRPLKTRWPDNDRP